MSGNDDTSTENRFTAWLSDHPRFMGALFVTMVLLTEAGAVAANAGSITAGP